MNNTFTVREFAEHINKSLFWVYFHIRTGEIPYITSYSKLKYKGSLLVYISDEEINSLIKKYKKLKKQINENIDIKIPVEL